MRIILCLYHLETGKNEISALENLGVSTITTILQPRSKCQNQTMSAKSSWNACTVLRILYPRPVSEALTRV